jgi:outer membrane lipoprotein-sorting protein
MKGRSHLFPVATSVACAALLNSSASSGQTPPPASTTPPPLVRAVADVQAFYAQARTYEADFAQKVWEKASNTDATSGGHVTFAKPGKMEWVYAQAKDVRVVSDGTTVTVCDPAKKRITRQPADKTPYPFALSFLGTLGPLPTVYSFAIFSGAQFNLTNGCVLLGVPSQTAPSFSKVLFYVNDATSEVNRVMLVDAQGNRTRFAWVNAVINGPVTAARFTCTPAPTTPGVPAPLSSTGTPTSGLPPPSPARP